ncbi:MAG: proprotein convertase P-domain-containing protein, partial [Verrucomicrobia bacterium]|nr:proprotein convertase P-domain-containing protein [Verrucomicrobiota bacterium]
ADYAFDGTGFSGTSGASPQIAGVCALIIGANTNLTVRDVQQILVLSARHFDFADAGLTTNGAGLRVSHNVGFGIPDAGQAVAIAKRWQNRPARTNVTLVSTATTAIPDDGLRLVVSGPTVPASLTNIACVPGTGPHADAPTAALPLADVGQALSPLTNNLAGSGALIQRGVNFFADKINYTAQAGANFAVIYNSATGSSLGVMGSTDFVPIPAVFIGYADGTNLQSYIAANPSATARIVLNAATYNFAVANTLLCEHVLVRVRTDHPSRSDLRITLTSPAGTRSILQHVNGDNTALTDWTYMTTHHFFEASAGTWTVAVSDEEAGLTGNVLEVDLTVLGVPIIDTDNDGLDDNWERANFGSLAQGPKDDPDRDGYSNMREQLMGTNPNAVDAPFQLAAEVSFWDERLARVSWPASTNFTYTVTMGTNVGTTFNALSNLAGRFPELELFTPYTNIANQFFGIRAAPNP